MLEMDIEEASEMDVEKMEANSNSDSNSSDDSNHDNEHHDNATNFSILEILKPDFGRNKATVNRRDLAFKGDKERDKEKHKEEFHALPSPEPLWNPARFELSLAAASFYQTAFQQLHFNQYRQPVNVIRPAPVIGLHLPNATKTHSQVSPQNPRTVNVQPRKSKPEVTQHKEEVTSKKKGEKLSAPDQSKDQDKKDPRWPAWVYCTRYSDRPSSGPRSRKIKKRPKREEEKRPRTAFTADQLSSLKREFDENRYLTEERRQKLAQELDLNESQIKIWFQNKRAKMKKSSGVRNALALQLMAQGLYNHSTMPIDDDSENEC